MIALLNCGISWSRETSNTLSYGGFCNSLDDSVLVSYDDLRIANSRMIELEYQKQINTELQQIIKNDSIVQQNYSRLIETGTKQIATYKKQRNIFAGVGIGAVILFIVSLFK